MEVRLKPDQENTMGPALGVIAGPFHLFPATLPAVSFPYRRGRRPGVERGASRSRG
jgi:hypothetical protein